MQKQRQLFVLGALAALAALGALLITVFLLAPGGGGLFGPAAGPETGPGKTGRTGPLTVLETVPPPASAAAAADAGRPADGSGGDPLVLNVTLFRADAKDRVAALVHAHGGTVLRGLDEEDGRVLRVSLSTPLPEALAGSPDVFSLEPYEAPVLLNDRVRAVIGADFLTVPGFATPSGLTGAGQIVAVADSGLDRGRTDEIHPDLASVPGRMPKVVLLRSWSGGGTADPVGHGTHVAATVAGTGTASGGKHRGVAPGASIYFQALLNPAGELEPPADLVSLFRPAYEAGARVHVNGWGGRTNAYRSVSAQVDRFVHYYRDFLPVFGAGNAGPHHGTLTPEANSKNALVVGASQNPRPAYGPDSLAADKAAAFSSRGPAADGRIKPDLLAPGTAVISARSALVADNYPAHPAYQRMEGTSMAAAAAGGSAVLLREYFRVEERLARPSAALLRAALVNGARPVKGAEPGQTFGILDLGATVLALREKTFHHIDAHNGLAEGEAVSRTFAVEHPDAPFSATLAWTDPPAAPGAARTLVNNLDLTVTAPDGTVFHGNDFAGIGRSDDVNNIERVVIARPQPGTYTVTVRAARVAENAAWSRGAAAPAQDFALVFGCLPVRETALGANGNALETASGGRVELPRAGAKNLVNGVRAGGTAKDILPGADLYLFGPSAEAPRAAYAVSATWRAGAVKTLDFEGETVFAAINPLEREGGYFLAPQGRNAVWINGAPGTPEALPPGVEITGAVNPSTQTLWRVEAFYRERDGLLAAIDAAAGKIRLVGDEEPLRISPAAAVSIDDVVVDGCWIDRPFGAAGAAVVGELRAGMAVRLVLSPTTGEVQYISARRPIAFGGLHAVDPESRRLTLETGTEFKVFPGAAIRRDRETVPLEALRPGDRLLAVLLPGSREVLGVEAFSRVLYGQVLYTGETVAYLMDEYDVFRSITFTPGTQFFRWGLRVDAAALSPGLWVRVLLDPAGHPHQPGQVGRALRFDVAERAVRGAGTLEMYDPGRRLVRIDGQEYRLDPRTAVLKNGYPVTAESLRPGERVEFTALPAGAEQVLIEVAARSVPGVPAPELSASGLPFNGYLLVSGRTSADRVHFVRADGSRLEVPLREGGFAYPVQRQPGETSLRVVAVDSQSGAVTGQTVSFPPLREARVLTDIRGSWAERDIQALSARNLMVGYPDGTFRPDRPVNRAEFSAVLVRLLGWPTRPGAAPGFADDAAVPDWARPSVAAARDRGLVSGYPDGTFRPAAPVTRAEAAAVLVRALEQFRDPPPDSPPPYADWALVPDWAQAPVSRAYEAGIFRGRPDGRFAPAAPVTRAELAAALNRFLAAGR